MPARAAMRSVWGSTHRALRKVLRHEAEPARLEEARRRSTTCPPPAPACGRDLGRGLRCLRRARPRCGVRGVRAKLSRRSCPRSPLAPGLRVCRARGRRRRRARRPSARRRRRDVVLHRRPRRGLRYVGLRLCFHPDPRGGPLLASGSSTWSCVALTVPLCESSSTSSSISRSASRLALVLARPASGSVDLPRPLHRPVGGAELPALCVRP